MPKIVYVTPQVYGFGNKEKDIVFYFPKNEMDLFDQNDISAFYFDYQDDEEHNTQKEFELQEEILITDNSKNYFIIIKPEQFKTIQKFIHSDIAKENSPNIDVIFIKLMDDFVPQKEDLYVFSSTGKIFPLYVGKENFFKAKKT